MSEDALGLDAAGENRSAWITLLTTEHYNLQTLRAATIGEANGRASIFLGSLSAGLIALGFQGGGRSAGTTTFQVIVLSALTFLGVVTFLRCLEISLDDWDFAERIGRLRAIYAELVPPLSDRLRVAAGAEASRSMLLVRRQRFQMMLSVAGTIGVITGIVFGSDVGALTYGLHAPLAVAIAAGAVAGAAGVLASIRFQRARWMGAFPAPPS
jgi:hypothetical protein